MNIEQIALEVADEMFSCGMLAGHHHAEFLRRCLAKIGGGLEPVSYATSNEDGDLTMLFFDKQEALTYCYGDTPVSLYATPHEAIIAAEQRVSEACAKLVEKQAEVGMTLHQISIRSGEWRKYIEE